MIGCRRCVGDGEIHWVLKPAVDGPHSAGIPAGMRGIFSLRTGGVAALDHRLRAGMPPASGSAASGGVGSFDECWQRPDRWKCDPIAGDEELMVQRGGRLVAVLESAVFSSGNRWQRRIRRSETRSGASGSGGDCRGMISAPAVRKSAVELRGRRDSLSFDACGRSACHCWHPCRDAGKHFPFKPVVSLRSPPATCWDASGIRIRCVGRHAPGTREPSSDGFRCAASGVSARAHTPSLRSSRTI